MKCPLCGLEFSEDEGVAACRGCPLGRSCHLVKCPNCGYETPREAGLVKAFKAWRRRADGAKRKS